VQDVLLSAWRRGLALDGEGFLRVAHGAVRKHAAFLARSAQRRRARECAYAADWDSSSADSAPTEGARESNATGPLSALSPTLRTTLNLLLLGLEKAELRAALGVTDATLRKRFETLRAHGPLRRPSLLPPPRTPTLSALRKGQVSLLPKLATRATGPVRRVLGTPDPDGHGIIFTEVLTPSGTTATSSESRVHPCTRSKGTSC